MRVSINDPNVQNASARAAGGWRLALFSSVQREECAHEQRRAERARQAAYTNSEAHCSTSPAERPAVDEDARITSTIPAKNALTIPTLAGSHHPEPDEARLIGRSRGDELREHGQLHVLGPPALDDDAGTISSNTGSNIRAEGNEQARAG